MYFYILLNVLAWIIGILSIAIIFTTIIRTKSLKKAIRKQSIKICFVSLTIAFLLGIYANKTYAPHFAMPPWMQNFAPHRFGPELPLVNAVRFLFQSAQIKKIQNIAGDPNAVPLPVHRNFPKIQQIHLTAKEVISEIAPGISFNYWTYNEQVPGPMFRVRVGDVVQVSLTNDASSIHTHNIDLHAVTGPGGGAALTNVEPGETKTFQWKALNPGLYVYHCGTMNVSTHNAHGQYGLILVEPEEGLPDVDKEFYLMQGELYTIGGTGKKGLVPFDSQNLVDGKPSYVTFNGKISSQNTMDVKRGDRVRIFVGNGGVNLISSFHIIGEIFDTVYPEGAIGTGSTILKNVQTTLIPAGGSTIVEFVADVPGTYTIVDHALARINKGAWIELRVTGEKNEEVFKKLDN